MNNQIQNKQTSFITFFLVATSCIFSGGCIGAITNMINGAVSPYYFRIVMNWNFPDIWLASVVQGIFEGILYGLIFSLIFTTGFGIITKGEANFKFAWRQLYKIIVTTLGFWAIGGIIAVFLISISPNFYQENFNFAPTEKYELLKYAWVGGSIWGEIIGGFISAILGVILIKNNWTKETSYKNQ
jgi:hypothetical protein